VVSNEIKIT